MKLVLAGSGTNLFAYVGAYRAFHEKYGPPDAVFGTSGGAIIGSLICAGYDVPDLLSGLVAELAGKMRGLLRWYDIPKAPWNLLRHGGIIPTTRVEKILSEFLPRSFDSFKIPFFCNTTDLDHNACCVHGLVGDDNAPANVVATSAAYPFVFQANRLNGSYHTDGGVASNFMIDYWGRDEVVGFKIMDANERPFKSGFSLIEYVGRIIDSMMSAVVTERIEDATSAIIVELSGGANSMNLALGDQEILGLIRDGYAQAKRYISNIRSAR